MKILATNKLMKEDSTVSKNVSPRRALSAAVASVLRCSRVALVLAVSAAIGATQLQAQATGRITGTVRGDAGQPIENAQVQVVGTQLATVSGADGRFTIANVPAGTHQIRVQRLGFAPALQQVTVGSGQLATADLQMATVAASLSEVVVVGYTTQQRRDISDATAGVRAEEIRDQAVGTIEEGLRGRVPGVVIAASGEPGRPAQVIVRGQNFLGNPTPLYVVDGMYMRQNPNLNPGDIESIEVLKDASAAAQYGSQAANGVVVVRTRRGVQADRNRMQLRSVFGTQSIPHRIEMMGAQEWARIQQQAFQNARREVPAGVTAALAGNAPSTDWQDAIFRNGAFQDHNLSVSGGSPNANYLISGGFLDQEGAVITTEFRRYNVRVNSDLRRGRFTLGENIALSRSNRQGLVSDFLTGFPLIQAVRMLPVIPVRDPNNPSGYGYGSGENPTFGSNPVGLLERRPITERSNQVIGSGFGEYRLLSNLRYRINLGVNYEAYSRSEFQSIGQIRMGSPNQFASLREIRNHFTSLLAENLLQFDQAFSNDAHRLSAVAGYTEQRDDADDVAAFRRGFTDEDLRTINAGGEAGQTANGARRRTVLQSFLVRGNYSLLNRYLLTGSVRRDGSSRFGASNRWGTFAAVSAGWIMSDEGFFRSIPLLGRSNYLKLRASTGTLGNQDIGDYRYTAAIDQNNLGYPFGGPLQPGATQLALANPDIRWQENRQTNFGMDMGLLRDRLTFTADVYRSTSSGLLVTAPLPWSLGVGEGSGRNPVVNAGSMRNSGAEFGLTHRMGTPRGFRLNTTATLTTTRNKVLSLGDGGQPLFDETGAARTAVGSPIGTFYLIRTAGIFQTAEEVAAHKVQPRAQPGDVRYVDANGDGRINNDDRVEIGNGTPRYSGGLFFDAGFGAFDVGMNLRGAGGFKIFNVVRYWTDRMDDPSNFRRGFEPWTPENRSTTTPRALATGNENTRFLSDRWIEDGDYLRVQNIILGYRLPAGMTTWLRGATSARVYLNLQNLHTFTGYTGWDPETLGFGNPLGRGVDDGRIYPNVRTISFGVDLGL